MSSGQVKGDGAGQVQAWHKWAAQEKYFRKPPLPLDLVGEDRSRPARRDSAASAAARGVQWQLDYGAQPLFSQDGLSPVRVPFAQGFLRTCAVPCRVVATTARLRGRAQCGAGGRGTKGHIRVRGGA